MDKPVIWWIRRDLRLYDNQALTSALRESNWVIPLFIFDPGLLTSPYCGDKRLAFMREGLWELDKALRSRGGGLVIRQGDPLDILSDLLRLTEANAIYAETDISPYAVKRDQLVKKSMPLKLVGGRLVHEAGSILKANGNPYVVFTPFSRSWLERPRPIHSQLFPIPETIQVPYGLALERFDQLIPTKKTNLFSAGEDEAQYRLAQFTDHKSGYIYEYRQRRDRLDIEGTSMLSPYLRFGMLSARQVAIAGFDAINAAEDEEARQSAIIWLNEIIWREFYAQVLHHFPGARYRSFRPDLRDVGWRNDPAEFEAWCLGETGYPVIDAAMRQLKQTGWMPNRARMIVASFLVKHLLIDWRWGERWFMQHLIDGDPASNNGGWQWAAGTGTDAAPYFRIFNPYLQGQKFDPVGSYVRRWIPELARVRDEFIHTPWQMAVESQAKSGCLIGKDYPKPIVDHRFARERALAIFRAAKNSARN